MFGNQHKTRFIPQGHKFRTSRQAAQPSFIGRISLKWKFSIAIVGLIIISALITNVLMVRFISTILRLELDEKGTSITQNLTANAIEPLLLGNPDKLQLLLNNVKTTEPDVSYAFILGPKKEILAHTFTTGFPDQLAAANLIPADSQKSIRRIETEQGPVRDIGVAFIGGDTGSVHIGISEKRLHEVIRQASMELFKITLLTLAGGIIIALFMGGHIARPIVRLAMVAEEIGKGNLDQQIPISTSDEIGWLAGIFKKMTADLKDQTAARNQAAEALAFRNIILTTQQENSLDGIIVLDAKGRIVSCTQRFIEMWQISAALLEVGNEILILKAVMHHLLEPEKLADMTQALADNPSLRQRQNLVTDDGRVFDCYSTPMTGDDGRHYGRVWYTRDITEQVKAEEELAREKERLAITLRSIGDGVISTDSNGNVVLINTITEQLTGWSQTEACGRPLTEIFPIIDEKTREVRKNPVEKVLETGEIVTLANHTALIARDGTEYSIADSAAPIFDNDGRITGVVLVFRDVTTQQKMESELIKTEKLESLGVLAGGIAHDFNNILTGIIGNISLARVKMPANAAIIAPMLANAEKACERARKLTQQLITFAKGGAPIKKASSIDDLLKDSARFALGGSNVVCEFAIADDLWLAEMDENQMSQVVSNLIINADQAMPDGGRITVSAENVQVTEKSGLPLTAGPYVKIAVTDQGVGINDTHLKKIFDPYFTTKNTGSGLGLASAFSIMHRHDGHITLTTKLDHGTTFYLYLPALEREAKPAPAASPAIFRGSGRILVMDDEDMVRDILSEMLTELGYTPILTRNGAEVVGLLQESGSGTPPFDAAILDLTIPGGMGGREVIGKLNAIAPGIKALVSSGYSNDPIMADHASYGFAGIISKPYKLEELSETLKKLL